VAIIPLASIASPLDSNAGTLDSSLFGTTIIAEAYVWSAPRSELSHLIWNYEDFESGKIWDWVDETVIAEQTQDQ
jgi:hypothetical protein